MLKKIKKFLNRREDFEDERMMRIFGSRLRDQRLWTLNRNGVANGTAVGLFCAYLPMPMQMLPATVGAIAVRGNVPLSLSLVWISNPLTWIPIYTPAYKLGQRILGLSGKEGFDLRLTDLAQTIDAEGIRHVIEFLASLWVGCLVMGAAVASIGYFVVLYSWKLHVVTRWRSRRDARKRRRAREIRQAAIQQREQDAIDRAKD